jgi:hypothetical protein
MKITKQRLKEIIKEELSRVLNESQGPKAKEFNELVKETLRKLTTLAAAKRVLGFFSHDMAVLWPEVTDEMADSRAGRPLDPRQYSNIRATIGMINDINHEMNETEYAWGPENEENLKQVKSLLGSLPNLLLRM